MYFEMQAFDNMIYHNNVIDNVQQVFTDIDSVNVWDNGDEGNYWSNYNGTDNDSNEIGDTPYIIDQNNQDNYPVINLILSDSPPKNGPSNPDPFSNLLSTIIGFITSGIGLLLLAITTAVIGLIVILVLVLNRKRKSLEVVK
jgi:hypothetical protein